MRPSSPSRESKLDTCDGLGASHSRIAWARFLRQPWAWALVLLTLGLVGGAVAASVSMVKPFYPTLHDEYSNLLAADTLLQGRLANPTPKSWEPLQTFHVIFKPSYASKYPLAPGLFIALGYLVFGVPLAGSWIAAGLAASSGAWMVAGVTSRRWATFGGLLIALHPAMQTTWSYSLAGGWATAAFAMLVLGAVFRLRRRFEKANALVLGVGIAGLALCRPFEGFVFAFVACALLLGLQAKRTAPSKRFNWSHIMNQDTLRTACFAGIPVSAALFCIAMQNRATTGSILRMPYQVHEQQYGVAPLFVFGEEKVPASIADETAPDVVRNYHQGWSLESYESRAGLAGWGKGFFFGLGLIASYWGIGVGLIGFIGCALGARYSLGRGVLAMLLIQMAVSSSVCWVYPHYLAPITACLLVGVVCCVQQCVQSLGALWLQRGLRPSHLASLLIAFQVGGLLWALFALSRSEHDAWARRRAEVAASLRKTDGKDLVLVHYEASHNVHQEWVYNAANLPQSEIIWARAERPEWRDLLLQDYGSERYVWELHVGGNLGEDVELSLVSKPILTRVSEFTSPGNRWSCFD
ncbi:MAG: hypothetical protein ACE361_09100 [Aureliella sp.]